MHPRSTKRFAVCYVAAAVLLSMQPAFAQSSTTGVEHKVPLSGASPASAVLDNHLAAFARRDIDAIMADYTEESVFITPQGVLKGKAEIRELFATLVAEFSTPDTTVTIRNRHVSGPVAYITWSAETAQHHYELATDTLYVDNGAIRYQTFAAMATPK